MARIIARRLCALGQRIVQPHSRRFRSERHTACCLAFFFQAEDGIRDLYVTGVQTCALPIWALRFELVSGAFRWIGVLRLAAPQPPSARRPERVPRQAQIRQRVLLIGVQVEVLRARNTHKLASLWHCSVLEGFVAELRPLLPRAN